MNSSDLICSSQRCRQIITDLNLILQNKTMEQNQNPRQEAIVPTQYVNQWEQLMSQHANAAQSITGQENAALLIEKWIWIRYEEEFKQYQKKLAQNPAIHKSLNDVIKTVVEQQSLGSMNIQQRYSNELVNAFIQQIRKHIQKLIERNNPNPEIPNLPTIQQNKYESIEENKIAEETREFKPNYQEKNNTFNASSVLPMIKNRGKVYLPTQLTSSFHLMKQTQQEYQIRSPRMFNDLKRPSETPKQGLFSNKYLKMLFKQFCKQSYNYRGLFQQFFNEADKMNMNKWMVFCKEFDFTQKFHKKEIIGIFHSAGKFGSYLRLEEFLIAVALLQQKYLEKYHKGEDFVSEVMHINSEATFRIKMANLKVNYAGPTRNSFEYSTYLEGQRLQEIQRQKQFQKKKKVRQIVLIKGMFEDHLKDEIMQLKTKRQDDKKNPRIGSSMSAIDSKSTERQNNTRIGKTNRNEKSNYSKIFQLNRSQIFGKEYKTNNSTGKSIFMTESNSKQTQKANIQHKNKGQVKTVWTAVKTPVLQQDQKHKIDDIKHLPSNGNQLSTWLTNTRTDSQQSDQILKQHLEIEKKLQNLKQSERMKKLMKQMSQNSKNVEKMRAEIQKQNEQDNDMIQTQVNFKKENVLT